MAIAADCKSVTLETPQVRLLLLPLLMADEEKHLMNQCGVCEWRRIKLGICAKNSAGCECVDIRIIAENNLKAREF